MTETPVIPPSSDLEPWEQLQKVIDAREGSELSAFLKALPPEDTAYTISRLDPDYRSRMFSLLASVNPDLGADLMEHFDDAHAADMLEELPTQDAAALVDEMDSDEQADVLGEVEEGAAEAILQQMDPEEARDVRQRMDYPHDTAGGLMITEFLSYPADQDVSEVRRDLRMNSEKYNEYEVRYLYGVDGAGGLTGVAPMRSLVMAHAGRPLREALILEPITVGPQASVSELEDLFDRVDLMAVPVVDEQHKLLGVVRRAAVQEAISESAQEDLAKFGGIIGGEELRSMSTTSRTLRRLAFLLPSVVLSAVAVTVILIYEPVIEKITLLAVFLPLVANLSGAAGNQAVAVSIRELTLGLVRPSDWKRVCYKEVTVGLVNGAIIGLLLGGVTIVFGWLSLRIGLVDSEWHPGLLPLAAVIATAYMFNCVISVLIGGTIPLALKAIKVDPAMASSPVLTTLSDMSSFLLTLTFAYLLLIMAGA